MRRGGESSAGCFHAGSRPWKNDANQINPVFLCPGKDFFSGPAGSLSIIQSLLLYQACLVFLRDFQKRKIRLSTSRVGSSHEPVGDSRCQKAWYSSGWVLSYPAAGICQILVKEKIRVAVGWKTRRPATGGICKWMDQTCLRGC